MNITDVKVNKYENGNTKGFASITIDNALVVTGLSIIEGSNGLFVSMPSRKDKNGEYKDVVFPNSKENRDIINTAVINAYNSAE